ncbi:MAG: glycosyltransferase family 2 protein, partial [Ornithinibacter sp.]
MTLAPTRPDASTSAEPAGVAAPSVTAVLLSRGDPLGMGELLEAVLGQALPPDEVLVLDRTDAGPAPRVPASGAVGTLDTDDASDSDSVDAKSPDTVDPSDSDTVDASESDDPDADTGAQADDAGTSASESASAERAETAEHAESAEQAETAERAESAERAETAGRAESAERAETAEQAETAERAESAERAETAEHAETPEHAETAGHAAVLEPEPASDLAAIVEAVASTRRIPVTVRTVDPRTPVRVAIRDAVREREPDPQLSGAPLLWILPVGAVPEQQTLVRLVDEWRRSPSAGLIGPKHVDAGNPLMLRALSIRTTRGGRLSSRPRPGEPDQGQYDQSTDVLAVPLAGSLIERSLLLQLRGWEPFFGDVGADLDLGWRAHIAGRRVVVVPSARVRTERGVAPVGGSSPARRRAARRVALARAPWWAAPFLAVWILLTSLLAAIGLLLLKRPRAAWSELTALVSVDPFRGALARRRTRQPRAVRRRDLRVLFEPRSAVLTSWGDAVHHAVVSPRAPIGDQANELNPRSWAAAMLRHPGVLATVGAAAVAAAAGRSL